MFTQFYPTADATQTREFVNRVIKIKNTFDTMSTATLQQYFIAHRTSGVDEAFQTKDREICSPLGKPNLGTIASYATSLPQVSAQIVFTVKSLLLLPLDILVKKNSPLIRPLFCKGNSWD